MDHVQKVQGVDFCRARERNAAPKCRGIAESSAASPIFPAANRYDEASFEFGMANENILS
jgi:hypothetical protein